MSASPARNTQHAKFLYWYRFISWFIVVSLSFPASLLTPPQVVYAQEGATVDVSAPFSEAEAAIGLQSQYTPTFDPIPEPESVTIAGTVEVSAASEETVVDPESLKSGVVVGVASATVPADGSQTALGDLQLGVRRTDVQASGSQTAMQVTAEVLPNEIASQLSPIGFAFKLSTSGNEVQTVSGALPLEVSIDYSQIPIRVGGGFAQRMHLYRVTKCDDVFVCRDVKELADVNDLDQQRITVDLAALQADANSGSAEPKEVQVADEFANLRSSTPSTVAQTATGAENEAATALGVSPIDGQNQLFLPLLSSSDGTTDDVYYVVMGAAQYPNGNYTATPLTGVTQYDVSLQTGTAQASYPIQIPPAAAGLAPQVSLNYNSGAVDALSSMRNSQGSWAGVGWDLETGYIQRRLDKCYSTDNLCMLIEFYTIVMNGISSRLIPVSGSSTDFRVQNDPRWKVEKRTDGATGHPDTNKEYWLVTTPDGTKYRFGGEFNPDDTNPSTNDQNSVFWLPVYNQTICPANNAWLCNKAWQWNLDRVQDPNGNIINYYYSLETNYYINSDNWTYQQYVRGGTLDRIDYGMRTGSAYTTTIPTRIKFQVEDRCNGACPTMPDTPTDFECVNGGACTRYTPTFWSKKRLKYVLPQVSAGIGSSNWTTVMTYTLNYSFPAISDPQSDLRMTLSSVTPSTTAGSLPSVQYGYTTLFNNRMTTYATGWPFYIARMNVITTELGGVVTFNYGQSHPCNLTTVPDNVFPTPPRPQDCVKHYGVTTGSANNNTTQAKGHWHRWKVLSMTTSDAFSSNPSQTITYTYSTPTGHVAEDPLPPQDGLGIIYIYYSDFRGSDVVTETLGNGTQIEHRFYRGLYDDGYAGAQDTTSARTKITLSDGTQRTDYNWYRGREVETRVLSITGTLLSRVVNSFVYTQTDGGIANTRYGAYFVGTDSTDQITPSSGGNKTVRTAYTYDAYGNVLRQIMHGDISTTSDDRTLQNTYTYSTTNGGYLVNRMSKQVLWSGALTTTNGTPGQEKSISEYLYDGTSTVGATPSKGNLTASRAYSTTTAYIQTSTTYDALGRPTVVTDARGENTTTGYHSFYGYATAITNTLGHVTTSTVDPRWGVITRTVDANGKTTNIKYDDFGRLQKVWLPTESTSDPASLEFEYHPEARPAWVKSRVLRVKSSSSYVDSWAYVDGFGRELQSQSAVASGGRSITSKRYNNLGQLLYSSAPYANGSAPGSGYLAVSNWATVANYSQNYYDGLGRATKVETRSTNTLLWYTQAQYDGWLTKSFDANSRQSDQTVDAFGKTVKVTEYNTGGATYNTLYSYDLQGNLTRVTDTLGNSTVITYNLLGLKTAMLDPDMGLWQYQYDGNGNLTMQQDALNRKLYMSYDDLNRLTAKRKDTPGGTLIADYSYDAAGQKGLLTKSRSYQSNGATVDVEIQNVTYDARYRLTQQKTIVNSDGTFRMDNAYNEADQKTSTTYPGGNAGTTGEVVSYTYNAVGQLTSVSGSGVQYVSSATYNAQGQMTEIINDTGGNGLRRQWSYETNSLRLSTMKAGTVSPWEGLQKLTYTYDNVGNITKTVDAVNAGQVQSFGYDWLNRLTSASTTAVGSGQYSQNYGYNATGNITNVSGSAYTYGDTKHKHAVTAAYGNSYQYDANGNQITRTVGGIPYRLTYDYENRLTNISGSSVDQVWVDDALPTGAVPDGQQDGWNWISSSPTPYSGSLAHTTPVLTGPHQHFFLSATVTLSVAAGDTLYAWAYLDPTNPPTEIMLKWQDGSNWEHRAYWGANTINLGTNNTNSRRPMGSLPPSGQWVKLEVPAALVGLEGAAVRGMAFAAVDGRLTWDRAGRRNGTNSTFTYDANGQRVKGVVNGVTTVYIGGVYEYQAGATTQYYEGNAIRRTGYETNNSVFYLLQDHLKSSSAVISQTGTVNGDRNYYLPFGGKRGTTPFNGLTTKRFTGQYHESSLPGGEGLSYYGARWYDAKLGRFLSADSIVPGPGNPQAFNRYAYVLNRPTVMVDPSGNAPGKHYYAGDGGGGNEVIIAHGNTETHIVPIRRTFRTELKVYTWDTDRWFSWNNINSFVRGAWNAGIFGSASDDINGGVAAWQKWGAQNTANMPKTLQVASRLLDDPFLGMALMPPSPGSLGVKISAARTAQTYAASAAVDGKTVASLADGSVYTLSGWKNVSGFKQATKQAMRLADEMGYTFKSDIVRDRGVAGQHYASHAEAQMAALAPNQAIGVSVPMCSQCKRFFSELAVYRGEVQVVADPNKVYIFNVDGTVKIIAK